MMNVLRIILALLAIVAGGFAAFTFAKELSHAGAPSLEVILGQVISIGLLIAGLIGVFKAKALYAVSGCAVLFILAHLFSGSGESYNFVVLLIAVCIAILYGVSARKMLGKSNAYNFLDSKKATIG